MEAAEQFLAFASSVYTRIGIETSYEDHWIPKKSISSVTIGVICIAFPPVNARCYHSDLLGYQKAGSASKLMINDWHNNHNH